MVARFTGYKNWHELCAVAESGRADPMDWKVDDATFQARGEQYIGTLMGCGIDRDTAEFIIDLAGPTGEGARGEELRQAVAGWQGPLRWTLRRQGAGYVVVGGDRKSELARKLAWCRTGGDCAPARGSEAPSP